MGFAIPDEALPWFTEEIQTAMEAISKPHITKKRTTVIKLAFAKAAGQPLAPVFKQDDVCSETIWYTKWQHEPQVKAAFEACYRRAMEFSDLETVAIERRYQTLRRRSLAAVSAKAPAALAAVMLDTGQRGSDRISAANAIMGWVDPEAAEKVRPASPAASFEQSIVGVGNLSDEELDKAIARELQVNQPFGGEAAPAPDNVEEADSGSDAAKTADA